MTITIEHGDDSDSDTQSTFFVNFYDDSIFTLVTHDPDAVSEWLSEIQHVHRYRLRNLVVGLDVEWRPNMSRNQQNPVATLQLCVGRRCLIYQLIHTPYVPNSLVNFLADEDYTFVGVGVGGDLEKLEEDYGFGGNANRVDLRGLAARVMQRRDLINAGLKELSRVVLDRVMEKPQRVTMSRWDWRWLRDEQIKYACVDAFVSFEIGRVLNAWDN